MTLISAPPPTLILATPDESLRRTLQHALEGEGCFIEEAHNSEGTLQLCQAAYAARRPLALVLIDTALPGIDALEVCHRVHTLDGLADLPVVVIGHTDDEATITRAFDCGVTDYIPAPVHESLLRQRVRHILRERLMQEQLRSSEERYRIISHMISDYAYAYDVRPDGTLIKNWNTAAFHDITGYTREELASGDWGQLIHPDDMPIALERYARLMRGESDTSDFRIFSKSGQMRWLRDHGYPVLDETTGRVVMIYGAAQDITPYKAYEEMLRDQAEELRRRNEELDAYAYTVAHDLKNPIASMMGFASLILNYYDRMEPEKVKEYLELIMEGGYKLKEIINALLLLAGVSKMDSAESSPLDMETVVESAKRRLDAIIRESSAVITTPREWPRAAGYAPWVEEVWANYISNAVKYGGKPPQVSLGADTLPDGMVRFWVQDNGRGLTLDEQQRVFTPFTRLNQVKVEGHGLGLSVVQRIVDKLGGTVSVESCLGAGSTFSFTLPPS